MRICQEISPRESSTLFRQLQKKYDQQPTHSIMHTQKNLVSMRWVGWAALLASLLVAVQIAILLLGKEGLCLSQGCQVVDQLTRVSPLLFNIAGLLYFQVVLLYITHYKTA